MANPPATTSGSGGSGTTVGITSESVQVGHNGTSVSVGNEGVGIQREFDIWKGTVAPIPTPVPGVFVTVTPGLKAAVGAAINQGTRTYSGSVTGSIAVGLEGGAPPAASVYLRGGAEAKGSLTCAFDDQGAKSAEGRIDVDMVATIGAQIADVYDYSVELGRARMFSFIGFKWERGKPVQKGQFELGPSLRSALDWLKTTIDRARALGNRLATTVSNATGGARRMVTSGLSTARGWISSWL